MKRGIPKDSLTHRPAKLVYANAIYGAADYLALPIGMLLAAPFLLKHLGIAQYGVWMLAAAAISSGGIVSGGFGDAVIKHVGECRGRNDWPGVVRIVRNMISINLILSGAVAVVLWCMAPYVSRHIVRVDHELQIICLRSLRIGSTLLVIKSIESIFISAVRAFETYKSTVPIAICSRLTILAASIYLAGYGRNVVWIMTATLFISIIAMAAQALALFNLIGSFFPLPAWHAKTIYGIASFGTFSWMQGIAAVAFSHADRFVLGFTMGAQAVAVYSLCVQASQPIHGLASSGMHFLFPHLSARYSVAPISEIRRKVAIAIGANLILVILLSLPVMVFGKAFLMAWVGASVGQQSIRIFPIVACSFALLGANVTAHYSLLATGQVRIVTYLNVLAGLVMLFLMTLWIPKHGLQGAALARLVYGPITCVAYLQMYRIIWSRGPNLRLLPRLIFKAGATNTD